MLSVADEPILTKREMEMAREVLQTLPRPLVLKVRQTRGPLSRLLRNVIEQLAGLTDKLQPLYEFDAEAGSPFLEVKSNLRYLSLPTGLELAPFLQTLVTLSAGGSRLSLRTLKMLETLIVPTRLEAFIAPACPHCPALVALCSDLALASSYLEVSIVDVTLFPEQARERGIRAVPTLVVNGEERLVGALGEEILVDRFVNRELATLHSETFRRILEEGDARKLAATMLAEGEIPGPALELLADRDWSVRLGMMVVLEEIGSHRPELARRAYPFLVTLLTHRDPSRRGDAAFLLGLIGDAAVLERLEPLAEDGSPEVAEAAREAIKRIRGDS
ncbi:MAG TPA: thioredoxin family protein [Syntrophobacteria bacterium]|nr:thioredoxin family protein [Syntrophobacteria bacterium]